MTELCLREQLIKTRKELLKAKVNIDLTLRAINYSIGIEIEKDRTDVDFKTKT